LVHVTQHDYFGAAETLSRAKMTPIVPHEPLIYIIAKHAKRDGCVNLINGVGGGAHGEWPQLFAASRREDFKKALGRIFVRPEHVLNNPVNVDYLIDMYTKRGKVDVQRFLVEVGTEGTAIRDAISCAGLNPIMPLATCAYAGKYKEVNKPHITEAHKILYGAEPAHKKALSAPYREWMRNWKPSNPVFKDDPKINLKYAKRSFLLRSVQRYAELSA
jgi:hypothetical protein